MDYSGSGPNQKMDDQPLPGYVPYLYLVFRLIATMMISLLSGWVVYTIKTSTRLHKPHNIFVANLLVSGMVAAVMISLFASISRISLIFQLGLESFAGCIVFKTLQLPLLANSLSLSIIAADKVVATRYPFKYKRMMTPRVIAAVITGAWLLAAVPTTFTIISDTDGYEEVPEYGICVISGPAYHESIWTFMIPVLISPTLVIFLNAQLAMKAHKIHKQIEKESALSGQPQSVTALKKKQHKIRRNRKPVITLLVIVLGSTAINILSTVLYMTGKLLIDSNLYRQLMEYIATQSFILLVLFLQPLVYGLYFTQVREPMMKCLKRSVKMNKLNSIAPQM